jgi:hypothetical protein
MDSIDSLPYFLHDKIKKYSSKAKTAVRLLHDKIKKYSSKAKTAVRR